MRMRGHEPWQASFHVSKVTQQHIQQAAEDRRVTGAKKQRTPIARATAVLKTLLDAPPERCNAANLVCALTLSAKVMGQPTNPTTTSTTTVAGDNFRSLLFQVLNILHQLLVVEKKPFLHSRQLCNVIWAIAKHYDRDPILLPPTSPTKMAAFLSDNDQLVLAETWDLNDDNTNVETNNNHQSSSMSSAQQNLDATVQAIARQLTDILTNETRLSSEEKGKHDDNAGDDNNNKGPRIQKETKLGELCMASWAFGVLRPRRRPPGWLAPPQMDTIPSEFGKRQQQQQEKVRQLKGGNKDFITFEKWTLNDNDLSFVSTKNAEPEDVADELFDAIGVALCRPSSQGNEMMNDFSFSSMYEPAFDKMRMTSCTWSELANVAWAFEKRGRSLSPPSELLLRSMAREAGWRLRTGGRRETGLMLSRDISQLIWALGSLQQDNFRLAHDLVDLVNDFSAYLGLEKIIIKGRPRRPFERWSCPDIIQMILSLAHARIDDSLLLRALFEEAHIRLANGIINTELRFKTGRKTFLAWEVSVMLWAQARLYLTAAEGHVFASFPQTATRCLQSEANGGSLNNIGIGPQEQANIAWALTVLQHHQSDESVDVLSCAFLDAAKACKEDGLIQLEHAHQLWQALFLLEEDSPSAVNRVPKWFRDYLSEKWNQEKSRKKISSARHKSISQVLNLMGVAHYNEHDEDIDVAIVLKRQASWAHQTDTGGENGNPMKVAVEFDGPNHFTRKTPRGDRPADQVRALGHTVLKYRLLKRLGWTVVRVPYYEFDKIPFWASMERQRYLQRLLKTHANIRFSDIDISEYRSLSPNRKTRFD